jgi:hypothetical protein
VTRVTLRQQMQLAATAGGLALAVSAAAPAAAQSTDRNAFSWEGRIPQNRWIIVRNLNGDVRVERGTGDRVEVTATKRWRRGDPGDVTIEVNPTRANDGSMVVCALWNERAQCDENGYHSDSRNSNRRDDDDDRNDVSVEFVVRVPAGVRVNVNTVNGEVAVTGATAEVVAHSVNGDARVETSGGPARVGTVNGSIVARMRTLGDASDLSFSSVNGSVTVEVPASFGGEVEMSTVNGSLNTEFPATMSGRISPRRLRLTVGDGSRRMKLSTVNGSIDLRRGR